MFEHMGDERVLDVAAVESPPRRELDYDQLAVEREPIGGDGQGAVYVGGNDGYVYARRWLID